METLIRWTMKSTETGVGQSSFAPRLRAGDRSVELYARNECGHRQESPPLLIDLETEYRVTGHAEGVRRTAEAFKLRHLCEDRDVVEIDHAATFSLMENRFHIFPSNQRRLHSPHCHERNGGGVGWQTTLILRRKG